MYTRFKSWSENGLLWFLLYQLQQAKQINIDIVWVDSRTIAVHRRGGGALKKKDLFILSPGERQDMTVFRSLSSS